MVPSAEHAVHLPLRREEPAPPRQVEVLEPLHREDPQVHVLDVGEPHRDELLQERLKLRPPFQHALVERRALLARQAPHRHKQRPAEKHRLAHRSREVLAPDHLFLRRREGLL
jgi:hypothetical protein